MAANEVDPKTAGVEAEQGKSLWADAWKRLKKNRMAMAGVVITIIMAMFSILADLIRPFDPETQERWAGAMPPWSEHLELRNEITLIPGEMPRELDVPETVFEALGDGETHEMLLQVVREIVSPVRFVVNGDVIERIEVRPPGKGVLKPAELVLGDEEFFRTDDGLLLNARTVAKGGELPAGLERQSGRYVHTLQRIGRSADDRYRIEASFGPEGKLSSLSRAGVAVTDDRVTVTGSEIADARFDGEVLKHRHVLGTDQEGRDTYSRLIYGGRISLLVGITATIVSLIIGVLYGATSGYAGGKVDAIMMRTVDVLFAVPYIFLVILLLVAFGRSIIMLFVALGAVQWLTMARIVRGQVLSLREKEFVDAAITVGTRPWRILTRHLIPNTMGVVVVYTTLTVPIVILQESLLAFLGLTVEWDGRPLESWGAMIEYGRQSLGSNGENWWLLIWPAAASAP